MNFDKIINEPVFSNGEMLIMDENSCLMKKQKINRINVVVEYPEKILGTIELSRVELFGENEQLLYMDNKIINHIVYFDVDDIKKDLQEKYGVNSSIIEIVD